MQARYIKNSHTNFIMPYQTLKYLLEPHDNSLELYDDLLSANVL
jgi:hypothetical protein